MFNRCELLSFSLLYNNKVINDDSMFFPLEVDVFLEGLFSIRVGNYFIDFINSLWKHFYSG